MKSNQTKVIARNLHQIDLPIINTKQSMDLIRRIQIEISFQIKTYHFACIQLLRERYLIEINVGRILMEMQVAFVFHTRVYLQSWKNKPNIIWLKFFFKGFGGYPEVYVREEDPLFASYVNKLYHILRLFEPFAMDQNMDQPG